MRTPSFLALAALLTPAPALACGGFFCSNVPMDQSKERIVFGIEAGEVEVHVQVFYEGEPADFAWVVPVAGVPDVGLSTDVLFNNLEWVTAPRFDLQYRELGQCDQGAAPPNSWGDTADFGAPTAGGGSAEADDGVTVLAEGQSGAFDWKVISATSEAELLQWLSTNEYDIPPNVGRQLGGYLAGGSNFVALKLVAGSSVGDITPIRLRYPGDRALIPIVLTSVAATPDMRLQPYVLGAHRAVPDNYLHVEINEAAVDWLSNGSNYDDVITRAANEAGGQAFATDFSGPTTGLRQLVYSPGQFNVDRLRTETDPIAFFQAVQGQGFPPDATLLELLRDHIPMPASLQAQGLDEASFYNCLSCYADALAGQPFDPEAFADDLDERVVVPRMEAQDLLDRHPTITRMTSSMSPDEMTLDPTFVLNPDMPAVSNVREADLVVDCRVETDRWDAPQYIELADGRRVQVPSSRWLAENGGSWVDTDAPAAARIERTSAAGQPEPIQDNGAAVDAALDDHNAWVAGLDGRDLDATPGDDTVRAAGCGAGCAQSGGPSGAVAGLGLLGLLGLRRRR